MNIIEALRWKIATLSVLGLITYSLLVGIGHLEFNLTYLILFIWAGLIPFSIRRGRLDKEAKSIATPCSHVQFEQNIMKVGELAIPVAAVKKVALESMGDRVHFSLPFNYIDGKLCEFEFPSSELPAFTAYLTENLSSDVQFIR